MNELISHDSVSFDVRRWLSTFAQRWRLVLLLFLGIIVPMAIVALQQPTVYTAQAKILLENDRRLNIEMSSILAARDVTRVTPIETLNSQTQLLTSSTVLRDLVRTLGLANNEHEEELAIYRLQNNIRAKVVPSSAVISVSYSNSDPVHARRVINTLIEIYQGYYLKLVQGDGLVEFYDKQFGMVDSRLKRDTRELSRIKEEVGIQAGFDGEFADIVAKAKELRGRLTDANIELAKNEAKASVLERQILEEPARVKSSADIVPNPEYDRLKGELSALLSERETMLTRYSPEHYDLKRKNREVEYLRQRLRGVRAFIEGKSVYGVNPRFKSLQAELNDTQAEIGQLMHERARLVFEIEELEDQLGRLTELAYEITSLEEAVEAHRKARRSYQDKLSDARFVDTMNRENITAASVIETALTTSGASKKAEMLVLALLLATLVPIGVVTALEWYRPRLQNAEDLGRLLRAPVLATLSEPGRHRGGLLTDERS